MQDLMAAMGGWTWWIAAAVLFVLELLVPGIFFLWLGFAAVLVGLTELVIDLPWQGEIAEFAVLSVVAVAIGRIFFAAGPTDSDQPNLNRRMLNHVGRSFVLDSPIVNGRGKLRIDDTIWTIVGKDADAGSWIRITGVEGSNFLVEAAEKPS
jgi:membrane protein implicated in regulation of membrane protease activity